MELCGMLYNISIKAEGMSENLKMIIKNISKLVTNER